VELNEAVRRIFLQHWWVIAVGVIVGATVGTMIARSSTSYVASTRMVIDSQDPKARSESTAIADTVRAIATSPAVVERALENAGLTGHDPVAFAADHVTVNALGTSGVLALKVSSSSRVVAAAVANHLARAVIATRDEIATGQVKANQARLTTRLVALSSGIAKLDSSINAATRQLARARLSQTAQIEARLANLSRQRDFLTQQRGILQSESASLLTVSGDRPTPAIISAAAPGLATAAGTGTGPSVMLGGLLGLVLALAVVALLETIRPTLVGGESVARELGVPHLGRFSVDSEGHVDGAAATDSSYPLAEAARRAGVANVDLLGVGSTVDLALIAKTLGSAVAGRQNGGGGSAAHVGRGLTIRPFGPRGVAEGKGTGIVVIVPSVLAKTALTSVTDFVGTNPWPLLGVLSYKPTTHWWRTLLGRRGAGGDGTADADDTQVGAVNWR
jgi:capsular polysaccharide biosynthesis protein